MEVDLDHILLASTIFSLIVTVPHHVVDASTPLSPAVTVPYYTFFLIPLTYWMLGEPFILSLGNIHFSLRFTILTHA